MVRAVSQLPEPFEVFADLFDQAMKKLPEGGNAMVVSTVDERGRPAARVCLLKDFDEKGFVFYTNLESRKGCELAKTPYACLVFWWPFLEKQVRIDGRTERVTDAEADAYFASRPRGSQVGAWASQQSRELPSREELDRRVAEFEKKYEGKPVPRPPYWSGTRVIPDQIEFWTGKPSRLHERIVYRLDGGKWTRALLYP